MVVAKEECENKIHPDGTNSVERQKMKMEEGRGEWHPLGDQMNGSEERLEHEGLSTIVGEKIVSVSEQG